MEEKISIKKEYVLNAYKHASEEQKALLENMFGKDMFKPKNIMERVKTFEDACEVLGEDHQYVKAYREWMRIYYEECKDVTAYLKLRIICAALNDVWKPDFTNESEWKYYSWFVLYTEEEYKDLDEEDKARCSRVVGGLVYAYANNASSHSGTYFGSRLAFKTRELAEYCGKQFVDIWADYLFG